jgi:hypothetical protein
VDSPTANAQTPTEFHMRRPMARAIIAGRLC